MTKQARATLDELRDELERLRKVVDAAIEYRTALRPPFPAWAPSQCALIEAVDAYIAERGE